MRLSTRHLVFAVPGLHLLFMGCDSQTQDDLVVYFPVTQGNTWTYELQEEQRSESGPVTTLEGTLTWKIIYLSTFIEGDFTIEESFTGIRRLPLDAPEYEEPVAWTKVLQGRRRQERLIIETYTGPFDGLQWRYVPDTPDTVSATAQEGRIPETYGVYQWEIQLKRGVGMVFWEERYSSKRTAYSRRMLRLQGQAIRE